jgi:predicted DNA-binding transcriptional regulator AlpA
MEQLLSTKILAAETGFRSQTFDKWRCARPPRGPKYIRLGGRIRYRREDVDAWLASRTVDPAQVKPTKRRRRAVSA